MPETSASPSSEATPISYRELLSDPAMALLVLSRTLDPIATTSIYAYMFAQLKWLSPGATEADIAFQAGVLVAAKTAAKCATGLLWGRLSDKPYGGRKLVLLVSLLTSCIATAGYGLSRSFGAAIFWQIFYGSFNNSIGIIRCMVAEIETRPRYKARALLLLPLASSIGQLVGPLLGGLLASTDSEGSRSGYPFFAPNIVLSAMNALAFLGTWYYVKETLEAFDESRGSALTQCYSRICDLVWRRKYDPHQYAPLSVSENVPIIPQRQDHDEEGELSVQPEEQVEKPVLSFLQIWTPQVVCTLGVQFILAAHTSTFNGTWSVFLASPIDRATNPGGNPAWSFVNFTGGVGFDPPAIGILQSTFTGLGVLLQTFLPGLNDKFGTLAVWRTGLCIFPFAYFIAPYSALLAGHIGQLAKWLLPSLTMLLFIMARTGAQPAMTLLVNACVPSPDARGTINVAATVIGNLSRSIFPIVVMSLYAWGFDNDFVVLGFWAMSALAVAAIIASSRVKAA